MIPLEEQSPVILGKITKTFTIVKTDKPYTANIEEGAESVIILATLLSRWRFRLAPDADASPVMDMAMYPRSLPMFVEPRERLRAAG